MPDGNRAASEERPYAHIGRATEKMHDEPRRQCRIAAGRRPAPAAAVTDSQSVKAAETVGKDSRGFDAGKKVSGGPATGSGNDWSAWRAVWMMASCGGNVCRAWRFDVN